MKKPPRTERRGGQWYYRRRVPAALVSILGFAEYRESLQTPDMAIARFKAAIRDAEVSVELQAAQAQLKATKPCTAPAKLSREALQYIREAVTAHTLQADEEFRQSQPDEDSRTAHASIMGDRFEESGRALALGVAFTDKEEKSRVEEALQAVGIDIPPDSPQWQQAAFKATEGYNAAMQAIYKRGGGEYVPTPQPPLKPPQGGSAQPVGSLTLGSVIDGYLLTVKQTGYTRKIRRCLRLFGEVIGRDTQAAEIKQKAVTAFLREICKLPSDWATQFDKGVPVTVLLAGEHKKLMSPTTYRDNYRAPLGAFLAESKRDHGDDGFPGLTVDRVEYVGSRTANEDQQRSLTIPELKTLFEGPQFAAIAQDPEQESLYWFAVLALYTGARPRELCQVNPQVDYGILEGIPFLDFSPHSAAGKEITKTVKTGEERRIPLHSALGSLGVMDYLDRLKAAKADRLFPGFRVKKGNPFEASGELFSDLLKASGLYNDTAPPGNRVQGAYVMRKSFITLCRNQGVVSKEITGHRDEKTTRVQERSYIFGPEPLQEKNKQLKKLKLQVAIPARLQK